MFSRRPDRPREEPRFAPPSGTRSTDLIAAPLSPTPWAAHLGGSAQEAGLPYRREEATVVAERDHIEGTLRSGLGVLVLGTVVGRIESDLWIRIGETAEVRADLVADEIVVAGRYEGHLVAGERLEIAPTGQLRGDIETPRLMLHEGGFIDGQLSMTPRPPTERSIGEREAGGDGAALPLPSDLLGPGADPGPVAVGIPVEATGSVRADASAASVRARPAPDEVTAAGAPAAVDDDLAEVPVGDPAVPGKRNGRSAGRG